MGKFKLFSSSSYDVPRSSVTNFTFNSPSEKNPNPDNYKVLDHLQEKNNLMVKINYPDCDNYEGDKILIYKNTSLYDLINQKHIDPHFSNNKTFKSPFIRLEPTDEGWELGIKILQML